MGLEKVLTSRSNQPIPWCSLAVTRGGAATFVIYGRSAKRRGGRGVTTDQNDKQHKRSDGPEHKSPCSRCVPKYTALPDFTPFNKQPMFQSHKPMTLLLPVFHFQEVTIALPKS